MTLRCSHLQLTLQASALTAASCPEFYPHSPLQYTHMSHPTLKGHSHPISAPERGWSSCMGGANSRAVRLDFMGLVLRIPPLALALCRAFRTMSSSFSSSNFTAIMQGVRWVTGPKWPTLFVLHSLGHLE